MKIQQIYKDTVEGEYIFRLTNALPTASLHHTHALPTPYHTIQARYPRLTHVIHRQSTAPTTPKPFSRFSYDHMVIDSLKTKSYGLVRQYGDLIFKNIILWPRTAIQ